MLKVINWKVAFIILYALLIFFLKKVYGVKRKDIKALRTGCEIMKNHIITAYDM
jgi:hypothetical protein